LRLSLLNDLALLSLGLLSLLNVVAWESLVVVRNVKTSVNSTLHGSEDFVSSGGSNKTNI